jgi:hypothetical protein
MGNIERHKGVSGFLVAVSGLRFSRAGLRLGTNPEFLPLPFRTKRSQPGGHIGEEIVLAWKRSRVLKDDREAENKKPKTG